MTKKERVKKKSTEKISDYVNQYDAYWNRIDGYFSGEWWQNEGKRTQSYLRLYEEAVEKGQLNLTEINKEKCADETNNKMLGFQAIANALRTGNWDNGTLSAIEDGLVSKGIDGSEIVTAEQLAILFDRNITWRESGYWLETSGLSGISYGVALMVIAAMRSRGYNCDADDAVKNTDNKKVNYNGKTVTQDNDLFDPYHIDSKGRTNIERMQKGLAPEGYDGKPVNIHHIDQTNTGPVMEVSGSYHQQNYSDLHSNTGQLPSQIDRAAFNGWRTDYWKWRANDFM